MPRWREKKSKIKPNGTSRACSGAHEIRLSILKLQVYSTEKMAVHKYCGFVCRKNVDFVVNTPIIIKMRFGCLCLKMKHFFPATTTPCLHCLSSPTIQIKKLDFLLLFFRFKTFYVILIVPALKWPFNCFHKIY